MEEKNLNAINIDIRLAKAMTNKYEDVRAARSTDIQKQDTKYVYIPRQQLWEYLDKYKNAKGIRVYFGVIGNYTVGGVNFPFKKEHEHQITVILKATDDPSFIENPSTPFIALSRAGYEPEDDFDICPPSTPPNTSCNDIDEN